MSLPMTSFFEFAYALGHRDDPPDVDGDLSDWDARYLLPHLAGMDGAPRFADVYAAWNEDWLAFAFAVRGKRRVRVNTRRFWEGDCVEVWIDTRDVRSSHKPSRHCHHFYFLPKGGGRSGNDPVGRQASSFPSPKCSAEDIEVASTIGRDGYIIEAVIYATGLFGYDVDECDRIGFNYNINDTELGSQYWLWGKGFPIHADPSFWGTLELVR